MYNLNLFSFPLYHNWRRPLGFLKNIREFFSTSRRIYQRTVKGYCYMDVYEMRSHLTYLIPSMLRQLAEGVSYPAKYEGKGDHEEWARDLRRIAGLLESSDIDNVGWNCNNIEEGIQQRKECEENLHKAFVMLEEIWYDLWD